MKICINYKKNNIQEAEGWPKWAVTDDDRRNYIDDVEKRECISLNPGNINKNPGKRALAKLMLNSFWGKVKIILLLNKILPKILIF